MSLILLNKKPGFTSFDALKEIKKELKTRKVGHTGTLDKFAQGLLIVLTGNSLKLTPWFIHCDKQYTGKIRFGIETDTLDPEGKVIYQAHVPSQQEIESILPQFTGRILQAPPVYSAIHINGRRASEIARSGGDVQMKERPVTIFKLELRLWQPPFAEIFVHCSSGTYIRSLARDIALAAGSRGYLAELTRTRIAGFELKDCNEQIAAKEIGKKEIDLLGLPVLDVSSSDVQHIRHGKPLGGLSVPIPSFKNISLALFYGDQLIAVINKKDDIWKYGTVTA